MERASYARGEMSLTQAAAAAKTAESVVNDARAYKREREPKEDIHSHIAVQLSLICTESHGSKSGKFSPSTLKNIVISDA